MSVASDPRVLPAAAPELVTARRWSIPPIDGHIPQRGRLLRSDSPLDACAAQIGRLEKVREWDGRQPVDQQHLRRQRGMGFGHGWETAGRLRCGRLPAVSCQAQEVSDDPEAVTESKASGIGPRHEWTARVHKVFCSRRMAVRSMPPGVLAQPVGAWRGLKVQERAALPDDRGSPVMAVHDGHSQLGFPSGGLSEWKVCASQREGRASSCTQANRCFVEFGAARKITL